MVNFSSCSPQLNYNQYDCYYEKMQERLKNEMKCLNPFQIHNDLKIGKDICYNLTDIEGKSNIMLPNAINDQPVMFRCF